MARVLCFTCDPELEDAFRLAAARLGCEIEVRSELPRVDEPRQGYDLITIDARPHAENPITLALCPPITLRDESPLRAGRVLAVGRMEEYVGRINAFLHGGSAYCRIHSLGDPPLSDLLPRIERALRDALAMPVYERVDFHDRFPHREFYRQALECMQVPIVIITGTGRIRMMNLRALARFDYPTHMVIDRDWRMLVAAGDRERRAGDILTRISRGFFYEYPLRFVDRHGCVFPSLVTSSRMDFDEESPGGKHIILTISDLTETEELQRQITALQRVESVERVVAGMTHDFNNLLTAILGHASLLVEDLPEGSELRDSALVIRREAEKARQLTHRLVGLSGSRQFVPEPVSCNRVVDDTLALLKPSLGEGIRIETELLTAKDAVEGDPNLLQQLLMNLCLNARDAMNGRGTLTVRTRMIEIMPEECRRHSEWIPGHFVELSVQDSGCGMTAEVRERAFEPFFTTKRRGAGSGLGLAVVRGIVRMHGGHVVLDSAPGAGTTIQIRLPAGHRLPEPVPVEAHLAPAGGGEGRGEWVLVIDDERPILDYTQRLLERAGYRVRAAATAPAATRLAEEHAADLAIVILDLTMPGVLPGEMLHELRRRLPAVPIMLSTGFAHGGLDDALVQQVQGFLKKPYAPEQLLSRLREILDAASEEQPAA